MTGRTSISHGSRPHSRANATSRGRRYIVGATLAVGLAIPFGVMHYASAATQPNRKKSANDGTTEIVSEIVANSDCAVNAAAMARIERERLQISQMNAADPRPDAVAARNNHLRTYLEVWATRRCARQ